MSDNWIFLISEEPDYLPDERRRQEACEKFARIAPEAENVSVRLSDRIQFFDCGSNLETILCPACGGEIGIEWWGDRMADDYQEDGFRLDRYELPCCGAPRTLAQLVYQWPQGFARFGVEVLNPGIDKLSDVQRQEFEKILEIPVRVIYRHI